MSLAIDFNRFCGKAQVRRATLSCDSSYLIHAFIIIEYILMELTRWNCVWLWLSSLLLHLLKGLWVTGSITLLCSQIIIFCSVEGAKRHDVCFVYGVILFCVWGNGVMLGIIQPV